MSRPLRVVALTRTSAIGPSTRYRILQYRDTLARDGIVVDTAPLFGPTWFALLDMRVPVLTLLLKIGYAKLRLVARIAQLVRARASAADVILVEQQLFPYLPTWIERRLWPKRQATILEFDDAIYLTRGHATKLRALCRLATRVIVGNEHLAEFARATARAVDVIPTTVDLSRYENLEHAPRDSGRPFRVGWIGLPYNIAYLETLAAPLRALAAEGPVELRVVSRGALPSGPAWDGVDVVARPWSLETEARELAACDVAVMPLPDTPWARGKCGLKLLQGMAAGVPVVASPVGVNVDIVTHGENGLLAATDEAWAEALRTVRDNPAFAESMARNGRLTVEKAYTLEEGARRVAAAYRRAAAASPVSEPRPAS